MTRRNRSWKLILESALNPETFTPFPKNPVIAAFFRHIGRADELGSSMRKMMRYGKTYGGSDPQLAEYTIPDKPTSRLQKYQLTEKGKRVLTRMQRGSE